MQLYEVTNGWFGESYVRVYVWAENDNQAKNMARASFERAALSELPMLDNRTSYFSDLTVKRLFGSLDTPFVTAPSDAGFNFEGAITEPFKVPY